MCTATPLATPLGAHSGHAKFAGIASPPESKFRFGNTLTDTNEEGIGQRDDELD